MAKPNIEIQCSFKEMVPVGDLKPNPRNRNTHPQDQIDAIAKILTYQGWRRPIVVSNRSGYISAGHGRLLAAMKLGLESVPVDFQDYVSEEMEIADMTADNALAARAIFDLAGFQQDAMLFGQDFDKSLFGFEDLTIFDPEKDLDEQYSKKITAPIYTPRGEKPLLRELYDQSKAAALFEKITSVQLDPELTVFLLEAARRHTVFNYEKIAEYYAHAPKHVQELMEDSALVIIDFNKAIENGFVTMTKEISEGYPSGDSI